jgi:hypothetical protein
MDYFISLKYKPKDMEILNRCRRAIPTPQILVQAMMAGISQWEQKQTIPTLQIRAPTVSSCHPNKMIISQAFAEQTREIGWENFLRGRLSNLWEEAYKSNTSHLTRGKTSLTWASEAIG